MNIWSPDTDWPSHHTQDSETARTLAQTLADLIGSLTASAGPVGTSVVEWIRDNGMAQAIAAGACVSVFLGLRITRAVVAGALRSRHAGEMAARNVAARLVGGTWSVLLLLVAGRVVVPFTPGLPESVGDGLGQVLRVVLILQVAVWLRILVKGLLTGVSSRSDISGSAATAISLITTLTGIVIWAFAGIMILNNLGIEVAPLLAGLGVGGLAIGLAAQSVFRDLFSSLAIVFDKPFVRGDTISFNDGGIFGAVEHIGMKTTRLRAVTGEQIIVGNSMILDKEIRNFQRLSARRSTHHLGVVYQTPHATLAEIPAMLEDAVNAAPGARFDRCHLKSYGDSGIVFELVFWADTADYRQYMDVQQQALLSVHRTFEAKGVEFAYPTRTVHLIDAAAR